MEATYQVVTPQLCSLGEGPVWDAATQTICWVDILRGQIHQFSLARQHLRTLEVGELVGTVALCTNGEFIAAMQSGLAFIDRGTGERRFICAPEVHLPGNRFNDGKCDPANRFWVGSMALSEVASAGNLYMIGKDLSYTLKIPGVSVSNGLAWSPDHRTLYYIDTPTREVMAYDFNLATGAISRGRPVIQVDAAEGFPDGMTIDTEGMLWIAHWDGWQVSRWDPHTGEKLESFELPAARITSCTFGGPNLTDLYVTSASIGLSEEELARQPLAGALFVINNSGFQGMEAHSFDHQGK